MADRRCHVAAGFGGKTGVSIFQSADIRRRRRRAMRAKKKTSPLSSIPWNLPLFYPPMGQPSALPPHGTGRGISPRRIGLLSIRPEPSRADEHVRVKRRGRRGQCKFHTGGGKIVLPGPRNQDAGRARRARLPHLADGFRAESRGTGCRDRATMGEAYRRRRLSEQPHSRKGGFRLIFIGLRRTAWTGELP
jgi:hypothetical protein